jgi:hypothetical protein
MPPRIIQPVRSPWARAMRGLAPVARSARPVSELRKRTSRIAQISTTTRKVIGVLT